MKASLYLPMKEIETSTKLDFVLKVDYKVICFLCDEAHGPYLQTRNKRVINDTQRSMSTCKNRCVYLSCLIAFYLIPFLLHKLSAHS